MALTIIFVALVAFVAGAMIQYIMKGKWDKRIQRK